MMRTDSRAANLARSNMQISLRMHATYSSSSSIATAAMEIMTNEA
jgi:hypothetical protein